MLGSALRRSHLRSPRADGRSEDLLPGPQPWPGANRATAQLVTFVCDTARTVGRWSLATTPTSRSSIRERWRVGSHTLESRFDEHPVRRSGHVGRVRSTIARDASLSMRSPHVIRQPSVLVLNDGATFEGYAAGHLPDEGFTSGESSSTPPSRVTRRSSRTPVTPDDHQLHVPTHRQLRLSRRRRTSRCARGARAS